MRFFSWLALKLYPRDFRRAHAHEISSAIDAGSAGYRLTALVDLLAGGFAELVHDPLRDISRGFRSLMNAPGLTLVASTVVALGVGANVAIYSVVNVVLLRPLPFTEPDRLYWLVNTYKATELERTGSFNSRSDVIAAPTFYDWQEQSKMFEAIEGWYGGVATTLFNGLPESIRIGRVSGGLFSMLGVQALQGRTIQGSDVSEGTPRVAALSRSFWEGRFGGDPKVVGQQILLDETPHTIVGVVPDSPRRLQDADVWTAWPLDPVRQRSSRGWKIVRVVGRLSAGSSPEQARSELALILRRGADTPYGPLTRGAEPLVAPLHEHLVGDVRRTLEVLWAAVGVILLIACANVAGLLYSRGLGRRREMSIRLALGAPRSRLVRLVLTESVLLAIQGGAAGVLLAYGCMQGLRANLPPGLVRPEDVRLDAPALAFALGVSLVAGLLFGLGPAIGASQRRPVEWLKAGVHMAIGPGRLRRVYALLTTIQVAACVVLLVAAGLLLHSLIALRSVELGYEADNVLTASVVLPKLRYDDEQAALFFSRALHEVRSLPGVEQVAVSGAAPLTGFTMSAAFRTKRDPLASPDRADTRRTVVNSVSPGYFRTFGIPLIAGRRFEESGEVAANTLLVNESLAKLAFPDRSPLGEQLRFGGADAPWLEIIGVVKDYKQLSPTEATHPEAYRHYRAAASSSMFVSLRGSTDPAVLTNALRRRIAELEPASVLRNVATMESRLDRKVAPESFRTWLIGMFAIVALLMASAGVFAVTSHAVSQRTAEIGVRMALGARRSQVMGDVFRRAAGLASLGVGLGLVVAWLSAGLLDSLLFEISSADPLAFLVGPLTLGVAVFLASFFPARRAASVDPATALRAE